MSGRRAAGQTVGVTALRSCRTLRRRFDASHLAHNRVEDAAGCSLCLGDLDDVPYREVLRRSDPGEESCVGDGPSHFGGHDRYNEGNFLARCFVTHRIVNHKIFKMTHTVKRKINPDSDSIPERLYALREGRLGLTQRKFARALGISQSVLSKWERGDYRPPPMALMKIGDISGGDSAWWYAQADPELAKAAAPQPKPPASPEGLDFDTLVFVVGAIQGGLRKRGIELPDAKFAELIALCYDFCCKTNSRSADTIERFLRVA